jgi:predicted metal-dependent hydrolase
MQQPPPPRHPSRRSRALGQAPARPATLLQPEVEVRRSARRRKTVSAYRDGERIIILLPARMSRTEERHWVEVMTKRLAERDQRHPRSDADLMARARSLSERHLRGRAVPASVRWVDNQISRWGSCTVEDGTIRLSARLRSMPAYVIDYVLLHELAHLLVPDHGPSFWSLLESYPRTERARGFLDGWTGATDGWAGTGAVDSEDDPTPDDPDDPDDPEPA